MATKIFAQAYFIFKTSWSRMVPSTLSSKLPIHTSAYLMICGPVCCVDPKTQILEMIKLAMAPATAPPTVDMMVPSLKILKSATAVRKSTALAAREDNCDFIKADKAVDKSKSTVEL